MSNNVFSPLLLILLLVLVLLAVVAVFYLYITARNRERLALIAQGMDPNLARGEFWPQVGIIGAGIGAGLMVGDWVPGGYGPLMAIVFAGGGLVVFNVLRRRRMQKN